MTESRINSLRAPVQATPIDLIDLSSDSDEPNELESKSDVQHAKILLDLDNPMNTRVSVTVSDFNALNSSGDELDEEQDGTENGDDYDDFGSAISLLEDTIEEMGDEHLLHGGEQFFIIVSPI